MSNNALGRGLASLIPNASSRAGFWGAPVVADPDGERVLQVDTALVDANPWQPRKRFDDEKLKELAQSIREYGIIQPLVVTAAPAGRYQLIAGERRLKAARTIGLATVPVLVRQAEEQKKLELSLIENVQRHDLNPIEEALSYRKLIDEFSMTQEDVAVRVGKSRSTVANTVRLLNLPSSIIEGLERGAITMAHAKVILSYETEEAQLQAFKRIVAGNLTVQEATRVSTPLRKNAKMAAHDPITASWAQKVTAHLGFPATIMPQGRGGTVSIQYDSDEDLKTLLDKLLK